MCRFTRYGHWPSRKWFSRDLVTVRNRPPYAAVNHRRPSFSGRRSWRLECHVTSAPARACLPQPPPSWRTSSDTAFHDCVPLCCAWEVTVSLSETLSVYVTIWTFSVAATHARNRLPTEPELSCLTASLKRQPMVYLLSIAWAFNKWLHNVPSFLLQERTIEWFKIKCTTQKSRYLGNAWIFLYEMLIRLGHNYAQVCCFAPCLLHLYRLKLFTTKSIETVKYCQE